MQSKSNGHLTFLANGLIRSAALIGLGLYGTGLLIVNWYLQSMGFSDFELFRARFIATGVLFFALWLLPSLGIIMVADYYFLRLSPTVPKRLKGKSRKAHFREHYYFLMLLIWVLLSIFVFVTYLIIVNYDIAVSSLLIFWGTSLCSAFALIRILVEPEGSRQYREMRRISGMYFGIVYTIICMMLGLQVFSKYIVSHFPSQYGGLEPSTVVLVVDKQYLDESKTIGLNVGEDDLESQPLTLLWQGVGYLIVGSTQDASGNSASFNHPVRVNQNLLAGWISINADSGEQIVAPPLSSGSTPPSVVETWTATPTSKIGNPVLPSSDPD